MAKYNVKHQGTAITNRAGGDAYKQSDKLSLASLLITSFAKAQYYRSEQKGYAELFELAERYPMFAAKAAIYARNAGMRSITHATAYAVAKAISGQEWGKDFYEKVISRPDDILEILSLVKANSKSIPHAMQKGFAAALQNFDEYQLAKYKGEGRKIKMVDAVNLLHPKPTEALTKLMKGELKPAETWEVGLTQAGQKGETEDEVKQNKFDVWNNLLMERKIGYFALLRNINNIAQFPELIDRMCYLLVDEKLIRNSKVLPFRYATALEHINTTDQRVINAINDAAEISLANVPKFDGKVAVVIDSSGSMMSVMEIANLFGAILFKVNDADLITFSDNAMYHKLNQRDTLLSIMNGIDYRMGGTNFNSIFPIMNKKYDRVIILSDMQGWVRKSYWQNSHPGETLAKYKRKFDVDPIIYSFDLRGYGDIQFPEQNVYCLAGFSDKVFDVMKLLETDRQAFINEIEKIQL